MNNLESHLLCIQHNQLAMLELVKQLMNYPDSLPLITAAAAVPASNARQQAMVNPAIISRMAGCSLRTGQKWLRSARGFYQLPPRGLVTVEQFASYRSIPLQIIYRYL